MRYCFLYHYSCQGYIYLQKSLSFEDTFKAKGAFKTFASTYRAKVLHCHTDNGHFADSSICQDLECNNQSILFCGVNAHWQRQNRGKTYQRPYRQCKDHAFICPASLARHNNVKSMAIGIMNGKYGIQSRTFERESTITHWSLKQYQSAASIASFSSFRVPGIRPERTITTGTIDQKVGRERPIQTHVSLANNQGPRGRQSSTRGMWHREQPWIHATRAWSGTNWAHWEP